MWQNFYFETVFQLNFDILLGVCMIVTCNGFCEDGSQSRLCDSYTNFLLIMMEILISEKLFED